LVKFIDWMLFHATATPL